MIDTGTKTKAIALLENNYAADDVAEALNIPLKLVEEWESMLTPNSLVKYNSNIIAATKILNGDISATTLDQIKAALDQTALDIASHISSIVGTSDIVTAQTLNVCTSALCKLYDIVVHKSNELSGNTNNAVDASFSEILGD